MILKKKIINEQKNNNKIIKYQFNKKKKNFYK